MKSAVCLCKKYISFHFLHFDLATILDVPKNYTMAIVAEHLNYLGIGICNLFYLHDCLKKPFY